MKNARFEFVRCKTVLGLYRLGVADELLDRALFATPGIRVGISIEEIAGEFYLIAYPSAE